MTAPLTAANGTRYTKGTTCCNQPNICRPVLITPNIHPFLMSGLNLSLYIMLRMHQSKPLLAVASCRQYVFRRMRVFSVDRFRSHLTKSGILRETCIT